MKNLIIPIDHLVMLAELDDKEAGQIAKAIAQYANKGIAPSFSNRTRSSSTFSSAMFCTIPSLTFSSDDLKSNKSSSVFAVLANAFAKSLSSRL